MSNYEEHMEFGRKIAAEYKKLLNNGGALGCLTWVITIIVVGSFVISFIRDCF